jgi:hypothetical protein
MLPTYSHEHTKVSEYIYFHTFNTQFGDLPWQTMTM